MKFVIPSLTLVVNLIVSSSVLAADVLKILNWSDYIDEEVLQQFESETNITIDYQTFDTEDEFLEKFFSGNEVYDVIVPTDYMISFLISRDILYPIRRKAISNYAGFNPMIMGQLTLTDPGNRYGVPYMWGTTGIGVNRTVLPEGAVESIEQNGWGVLFDASLRQQFSECGIASIYDRDEIYAAALTYLGFSINSATVEELQLASELIGDLAKDIRYLHSTRYKEDLADGGICMAIGYSGDILAVGYEMDEPEDIQYFIPKQGGTLWVDVMAIPKNSTNKRGAEAFISFLSQPEIAATNTNYNAYPNPLSNSDDWIDEEILQDPGIYPLSNVMKRLEGFALLDRKTRRLRKKYWVMATCRGSNFCEVPIDIGY